MWRREKGEADFVQRLTDLGVRGDILNPITGLPLFINQHRSKINFIFCKKFQPSTTRPILFSYFFPWFISLAL